MAHVGLKASGEKLPCNVFVEKNCHVMWRNYFQLSFFFLFKAGEGEKGNHVISYCI